MGLKIPYFANFGEELKKKPVVIFEINTLIFVYFQNFMKKQKCLNLEPKMPDLGIFGMEPGNNIVISEINTFNENALFGKKRALFGYFWDGI